METVSGLYLDQRFINAFLEAMIQTSGNKVAIKNLQIYRWRTIQQHFVNWEQWKTLSVCWFKMGVFFFRRSVTQEEKQPFSKWALKKMQNNFHTKTQNRNLIFETHEGILDFNI